MATKRRRSEGSWEFRINRAGLLPKPIYLSFPTELEGDEHCRKLEAMLDLGIVPPEFLEKAAANLNFGETLLIYQIKVDTRPSETKLLDNIYRQFRRLMVTLVILLGITRGRQALLGAALRWETSAIAILASKWAISIIDACALEPLAN